MKYLEKCALIAMWFIWSTSSYTPICLKDLMQSTQDVDSVYFFVGCCSYSSFWKVFVFHVGVKLEVMCSAFPLPAFTVITFDEEAVDTVLADMTKITTLSSLFFR